MTTRPPETDDDACADCGGEGRIWPGYCPKGAPASSCCGGCDVPCPTCSPEADDGDPGDDEPWWTDDD